MALWPKRLTGQLALVVALALLLGQLASFGLLARAESRLAESRAEALAQSVLLRAAEWERSGTAAMRERRMRRRLDRRRGLILGTEPPEGGRPWPAAAARLAEGLEERGFDAREVRAARITRQSERGPRRAVALSASLPGGWLTASVPLPPRGPVALLPLIAQTALIYLAVLLPVLWLGRRISRPLAQLTEDLRGYGAAVPPPRREEGPEDVRALSAAFAELHERIRAMLAERDALLGAIGHDLRTPITSLRLRAERIEDAVLREKMIGTLRETEGMLEDVLALARTGAPAEAAAPADLAALLREAAEEAVAAGRKLTLGPAGPVVAPVHRELLKRALQNLIDNADRYAGGGTIGLAREGGQAVFTIADEGPGIPPGPADRLLEPFARGEASRSRRTGGAGLGLAIAARAAQLHGGTLSLRNKETGGLEARLSLPLS
ncbi:sensor histidine kinase [Parvularcula oceani]|uniref:sensor histidine kinase n=1 Tax=Parvularcula oceani TaxID=1247963 RepID=UPI0004E1CB1E|nr:ATP-binding protein [Parvularcula oceani]